METRLPTKVVQAQPRFGRLSYSANALKTALRSGPFDVVFCGHLYQAPLAAALGKLARAPVWVQTHGIEAWPRPSLLTRSAVARADLITAVSRHTRRRVLSWANVSRDRVRVLPNTVRPAFSPGPRSEATLSKLGTAGARIILTVSRIAKAEAYKGHDRVIEAMALVRQAEPRALYVIVGDGDGRADLEALAERRGVSQSIRFLGHLSDEDVLSLYRSADAFVMPSEGEGFGIVFVEAAACGLPVVAGNADGSVDALADGALGRLVDPRCGDEIAGALIEILRRRPPAALDRRRALRVSPFCESCRRSHPNFRRLNQSALRHRPDVLFCWHLYMDQLAFFAANTSASLGGVRSPGRRSNRASYKSKS